MKKILFLLAGLLYMFASCSDGGSDNPVDPEPTPSPEEKASITLNSTGLTFSAQGGEQSITFTTNMDWTLSVASTTSGATWCTASTTNGSKGNASVKFTAMENADYNDRSVSVTIKAGTASKTFTVTQKGADALLVTSATFNVEQAGGTIEVEVKANINYQLEVAETAKSWITESNTRALTTKKHRFTIAPSEELEKREGEIYIKSGDKQETVKVYQAGGAILMLSKNEYAVSSEGETITVDLKSNTEYDVKLPEVDWIHDLASTRGMSSHTLQYVVDANETYDSRSAEIIFLDKNNDLKDTLKIIQAQKDAIIISQKEYEVKAEGETIEVKLSANVDYEVTMPDADWISQVQTRGLTEHTLYFKVAENTGEEKRTAEIVISNKDSQQNESITINQKAKTALRLVKDEYTVSSAGETISVALESNVQYDVQMPDVDWITTSTSTRGVSTDSLKLVIAANETYDSRSAEIIFLDKNSDLKDTLKIIQAQKDAIIISQKEYEVKSEGETIEVKLSANVDYEVTMPDADWISQVQTRGLTEHTLYFKVAENTGEEKRTAEIVISNKDSQLSEKVTINQKGKVNQVTVTLTNAGTMKSLLGDDYLEITNLKVVGSINGDDVYYLRKMLGATSFSEAERGQLTTLDLSEATIVEGGEWYYEYTYSGSNEKYYTSNNVIGGYMFSKYTNLQSISLPNNIISIGKSAFSDSSSLKSVYITDLSAWCKIDFEVNAEGPLYYGADLYLNNELVTELTIPDNVTEVKGGTFEGCKSITKVNIPDHVTSIGRSSFENCSSLTNVCIGKGVTSIGIRAFSGCSALASVTIDKGVTSIGEFAFSYCKALTSIVIPDSVTSIGHSVFSDCI